MGKQQKPYHDAFSDGMKHAVEWLHARACSMNDPHAQAVLNSAAYHLGCLNAERRERLSSTDKEPA